MATTADLKAALMSRYSGDAWALFWEVPDGTGRYKDRTADAVAMSLWPSRGLDLHGFEVKASRADWLKELKQPDKAESICRYCDYWWIVAARDVVKEGELPPTWGLLVLNGRGLVQSVVAPRLTPEPIDRGFMAGLCRAACKSVAKEDQKLLAAARQAGFDEGQKAASKPTGDALLLEKLTASVAAFEEVSGVRISRWGHGDEVAKRVKEVVANDHLLAVSRREIGDVRRAVERLTRALNESD